MCVCVYVCLYHAGRNMHRFAAPIQFYLRLVIECIHYDTVYIYIL